MTDALPARVSRATATALALLVALAGCMAFAAPTAAKQLEPSVPSWAIKDIGDVVATRDTLTVTELTLRIGSVGMQDIRFLFELAETCCEMGGGRPVRFLGDQPDAACDTVGTVPTRVVECVYKRNVMAGQPEMFTFRHRISPPGPHGQPYVWMTIFVGASSMGRALRAQRVAPEADLLVAVDGPGAGRIGDIVEFTWSVTNIGLDSVWGRSGQIIFVAPSGTEFAGSLAESPPDDMICYASATLQIRRDCWLPVIDPGQAKARKETWRLKILSGQVGDGKVEVKLSNLTGVHPEGDYADPTPANNVAAIRVNVMPAPAPANPPLPGSVTSGPPSPAGSADPGALPLSGSAAPDAPSRSTGPADPGAQPSSASVASGEPVLTARSIGWTAAATLCIVAALVAFVMARRRRSTRG